MESKRRIYDNESGVSVLVGTLMLILVAVVGSIGIGLMYGGIATDVSKHTGSHQLTSQSGIPISIGGADNMNSLTQSLAAVFYEAHPSLNIQTGSMDPDGIYNALTKKMIDVGAVSSGKSYTQAKNDPSMKITQIGMSNVVVIENKVNPVHLQSYANLTTIFVTGSTSNTVTRSDSSSITATTFYAFLGQSTPLHVGTTESSDVDVINYVGSNNAAIGFADFSDVKTAIDSGTAIQIVGISDGSGTGFGTYTADSITLSNLALADKDEYRLNITYPSAYYNLSLSYPLYYINSMNTGAAADPFIKYVTSTDARTAFKNAYAVSIVDL